ncbi:guanine deaminase [Cavenderia fasciculata]|uniref:guanine deaminase n=1 Tax=Cavenderia fasciculata TaxID=261658 RepID=F4Q263_CACFS|nr:guanine deaminase [Cavenderia fasciculata]EGG18083.1 guanine deaminase [Cavenderia fasciculata]|eukprot:XP_004366124.1 guanine deaminase [Cavenderia fasciculata]
MNSITRIPIKLVFRGTLIHSLEASHVQILENSLIGITESGTIGFVKENVVDDSKYESLKTQLGFTDAQVVNLGRRFIIPGFIDTHAHAPQYHNAGTGTDLPLLKWLEKYTFPTESKFRDLKFADNVYRKVVRRMLRNGTTTCCYFATIHTDASKLLAEIVTRAGQRAYVGKVCMDRHSPDHYVEQTDDSVRDTEEFITAIKAANNPLVQPIVTPRFAPSCSDKLMKELGALSHRHNTLLQSHISENIDECKWVQSLYPQCSSYTDVYSHFDMMHERTIMAHGCHLSETELRTFAETRAGVSHCPVSNFTLSSGALDVRKALGMDVKVGLGTDVSGGYSASMLVVIRDVIKASNSIQFNKPTDQEKKDYSPVGFEEAFYLATVGGSKLVNLQDTIGNFIDGKDFDAQIIDPFSQNSPFDVFDADTPLDIFQKFIFLGDDRNVDSIYVKGHFIFIFFQMMNNTNTNNSCTTITTILFKSIINNKYLRNEIFKRVSDQHHLLYQYSNLKSPALKIDDMHCLFDYLKYNQLNLFYQYFDQVFCIIAIQKEIQTQSPLNDLFKYILKYQMNDILIYIIDYLIKNYQSDEYVKDLIIQGVFLNARNLVNLDIDTTKLLIQLLDKNHPLFASCIKKLDIYPIDSIIGTIICNLDGGQSKLFDRLCLVLDQLVDPIPSTNFIKNSSSRSLGSLWPLVQFRTDEEKKTMTRLLIQVCTRFPRYQETYSYFLNEASVHDVDMDDELLEFAIKCEQVKQRKPREEIIGGTPFMHGFQFGIVTLMKKIKEEDIRLDLRPILLGKYLRDGNLKASNYLLDHFESKKWSVVSIHPTLLSQTLIDQLINHPHVSCDIPLLLIESIENKNYTMVQYFESKITLENINNMNQLDKMIGCALKLDDIQSLSILMPRWNSTVLTIPFSNVLKYCNLATVSTETLSYFISTAMSGSIDIDGIPNGHAICRLIPLMIKYNHISDFKKLSTFNLNSCIYAAVKNQDQDLLIQSLHPEYIQKHYDTKVLIGSGLQTFGQLVIQNSIQSLIPFVPSNFSIDSTIKDRELAKLLEFYPFNTLNYQQIWDHCPSNVLQQDNLFKHLLLVDFLQPDSRSYGFPKVLDYFKKYQEYYQTQTQTQPTPLLDKLKAPNIVKDLGTILTFHSQTIAWLLKEFPKTDDTDSTIDVDRLLNKCIFQYGFIENK